VSSFKPQTRTDDAVIPDELVRLSQVGGGSLVFAKIVKILDETITSDDVLHDDDELFFTVNANKTYFIMLLVLHNSAATPDIKYAMSIPAGASILTQNSSQFAFRTEAGWDLARDATSAIFVGTGNNDGGTGWVYRLIVGATAGEVNFQWAQNTSDAATTSVLQGSLLLVYES